MSRPTRGFTGRRHRTGAVLPPGQYYVGFAEGATDLLLAAGARADRIRIERFGPSG